MHKSTLGFRGLTGNHTWVTQPFALLLAFLLLAYVVRTSSYLRDSNQFVAELNTLTVPPHALLVTYDVERLYPSIPHRLCITMLATAMGCTYTAFLMAILEVVLNENYCYFAGYYWKQIIGFATGVACGSEVAHLFLHALFKPVFDDPRYADFLLYNKRYIDDGGLIWVGSEDLLREMLAALNACCSEINITFVISTQSMILLDVRAFKGERHRATGILDTEVYQKEMNLYLYTPPTTEHPRSSHLGLIKGEMIRYITKSSSFKAFVDIACLFYQRLRARGFSSALLAEAFSKAPSYDIRDSLLTKALAPRSVQINDLPVKIFSPIFSRSKVAAGLPRAIFFGQNLLSSCQDFPEVRLVNAWRVSNKIGGRLLTYRFPAKEDGFVRPALWSLYVQRFQGSLFYSVPPKFYER